MPLGGETIGTAYVRILASGKGFDKSVRDQFDDAEPAMVQAGEQSGKAYKKGFDDEIQRQGAPDTLIKAIHKGAGKFDAEGAFVADGFLKGMRAELEDRFPGDIGKVISKNLEQAFNAGDIDFDQLTASLENLRPEVAKAVKQIEELNEKMKGRHLRALREWEAEMNKVGDSIGRAFGKGSRNDFLNFFGSVIGKLATLPTLITGVVGGMVEFGQSVSKAFTDAGGGASGFLAAAGKIGGVAGGAVLGVIGLTAVVSTLSTALLLAAGAAAALASALAFGLIGAIAPLVGVFGPLSLAVIGVASAFIGMSEKAKKATKEAFEPLKEQLKELGNAARPGILDGITAAAENLEEPLKRLKPLFKVIGESVGTFIDTVTKVSFGPGFERFVSVMSKTLPATMETLGRITGNVLDGMAGLFATLEPTTTRFLTAVEGITDEFAKWSISPAAADFFDKAADSADALLDFLRPVWDLTKQILDAGRGPGNDLFRSMGDAVQGWVNAINENPNILRDFFEDAKRMGEAIGNAVTQVGRLIDAMDTPTTRDWAVSLIEGIGDLIGVIADLIGWFTDLDGSTQHMIEGIALAVIALGPLRSGFGLVTGAIQTMMSTMQTAQGRMTLMGGAAKGLAGAAGIGLLIDGFSRADGAASTLETTLGGAALGFSVGGPWGAAIGGAAGLLGGLVKNYKSVEDASVKTQSALLKSEGFKQAKEDAASLAEALVGVVNTYGDVTRAAVEASFMGEEGKLDKDIAKLRELDIAMDTIVSASLGDSEAVGRVMSRLGTETDSASTHVENLTQKLHDGADGVLVVEDAMGHLSEVEVSPDQIDAWEKELEDANTELAEITSTAATFEERIRQNGVTIQEHAALVQTLQVQLGLTAKEYGNLPKNVRIDIESRGLPETVAGAERLIEKYKGLQNFKSIRAVVSAPGVDLTAKDIQNLAGRYKLLPKQIRTLVRQEGVDLTRAQFRKLIRDAKDVDNQKPEVTVKADVKPARDDIADVGKDVDKADRKTAEPKVKADKKNFDDGIKNVNKALDNANGRSVNPKINVDASGAFTTINSVTTALNNIADETVYVNVVRRGGGGGATASGGMFYSAQTRLIGEAGAEAVVPMSRPLAMVDPAVRDLAAYAQGLAPPRSQQPAARAAIDVGGVTIITPTENPAAVAQEVMNRLVAVGY